MRDFRPSLSTLPVPLKAQEMEQSFQEVPPEMENRLKRLYRRLALKYHPDKWLEMTCKVLERHFLSISDPFSIYFLSFLRP